MGKKYNLSSSSDMRRFSRDLEKKVTTMAMEKASTMSFQHACPHCMNMVAVHAGLNICPFCHKQINVELNFNT